MELITPSGIDSVERDNKLVSINIWSKQNLTLLEATNYLKNTRSHFESQNYKVVYAQENWSNPNLIMKNLQESGLWMKIKLF